MKSPDRLPKVGRFYTLPGDSEFFEPGSFLAKLTKFPFFLLKVRESELAKNASAYFIDFIVGEKVYENVLVTCAAELELDPVEEDEEE